MKSIRIKQCYHRPLGGPTFDISFMDLETIDVLCYLGRAETDMRQQGLCDGCSLRCLVCKSQGTSRPEDIGVKELRPR